jgi:hypothetical protein
MAGVVEHLPEEITNLIKELRSIVIPAVDVGPVYSKKTSGGLK